MALERLDLAAAHLGFPVHAHHARDVGPVDIGVHEADAPAWSASAVARFTEMVDLPTPPLPEETASTLPRCGSSTGVGGGGTAAAPGASPGRAPAPRAGAPPPATVIFTPVTPATACTALRTSRARVPWSP